jgi:hypothetical protein
MSADDGRLIWQRELPETNGLVFPSVWRSYVLMQDKNLALHVMRARDGKDVRVLPMNGLAISAPIGTPNRVVVVTSLFLHIDLLEDPKSVKRFRSLGGFKMIQGHRLFVVDRSWIYLIDPQSWSIEEVREFGSHQAACPALAYGKLVIENGDGYLEAYSDSSAAAIEQAP